MSFKTISIIPDITDSIFSDRFNKIDKLFSNLTGNIPVNTTPKYNIKKTDNNFELTISLPGWKKKELEINVINNKLNIIGTKEKKKEEKNSTWIYKSILKNNFNISYNISKNSIIKKAKLKKGLLTIKIKNKLPKQEKPQKININSEKIKK